MRPVFKDHTFLTGGPATAIDIYVPIWGERSYKKHSTPFDLASLVQIDSDIYSEPLVH